MGAAQVRLDDAMMRELCAAGYHPFRLGIQSMGAIPPPSDDSARLLRALKELMDPAHVLAPGRYGLG